jgi:NADH-quinone oxidoreductase subunit F
LYGEEFCGGIRDDNQLKAFVPGGGSAPWFLPDQLDLPFEAKLVGAAGSMLGSGAVMVMDETTDIVAAAYTLVRFYAHESCGKCTPCREGGTWLERIMKRLVDGHGTTKDLDQLYEIGQMICPGEPPTPPAAVGHRGQAVPVQDDDDLFVGPRRTPLSTRHTLPRRVRSQDASQPHPGVGHPGVGHPGVGRSKS